ncbi:MAG: NAD-dependent epimerase/dehydratase family protein [Christensenellaceae bacterium]
MRTKICGATILVTGGAGFIGSHLVDHLIAAGAKKVVVVDNLFVGKEENLKDAVAKGAIFIKDDAEIEGTLEYIIKEYAIEVVFNCATKALNYSFINPVNAYMTNVNIMKNLLELQRKGAFLTLCHFSSSEVYGSAVYEPMDEKHPFFATTTYAAGKAAADIMLYSYVNQYQMDAFIVRPFNNYGPRQNADGALAGIIPLTAKRIMQGIPPEIHGTGEQSRDFIFVYDTVDAVLKLYDKMKKGDSVNISTNGQIKIKDLMQKMVYQMNFEGEIVYKKRRNADVDCHHASNKKLLEMIDFEPVNFDEGLKKTIAWYRENIRL